MKVLSGRAGSEKQLQREVVSCCREALQCGADKRHNIGTADGWNALRQFYLEKIRGAFPDILFDKSRHMESRVISAYELADCRIENVIFESLPGWEVNGTVYLPKPPGRHPGVICPTGHSAKTFRNYQRSARTFARNGYIAISFDPPGCSGEKQFMNDHFINGIIGYLTGFWSMTHFVADAIWAMDYLQTRADVDVDAGFTMTGVSGGGLTALFATILDERVKFCAPVCCLSEHEKIHLTDLYTSCPEQFGKEFIAAGIDYADYLCLIAPRPCLVMAGKLDEVFDIDSTERLFHDAAAIYGLTGSRDNFGLFIDDSSGHAYTVKMANTVAGWMNRIIKGTDMPALDLEEQDIGDIGREQLACKPSEAVNMFTINRDEARRLHAMRKMPDDPDRMRVELIQRSKQCLGIHEEELNGFSGVTEHEPEICWYHAIQKIDIQRDQDIHIPGLIMKRAGRQGKHPALLFIDENGKWAGYKKNGFLSRLGGFLEKEPLENEPIILNIDVSGFGELEPDPTAYDLAYWNDIERILTYLSIANGRPIMGLRVRDALAALSCLSRRHDVDADKIMIGGRGVGAIVALHAALLWENIQAVTCLDMLSHYGALTEKSPFAWRQSVIIPDILKYYDLPDIAACLAGRSHVHLINLLDAEWHPLEERAVHTLYGEAIRRGAQVRDRL